jgi:YbbR domain-containing protein
MPLASKIRFGRRILEDWPAKVLALALAVVIVLLTDIAGVAERYFTVSVDLRLADDVVPGESYVDRVRVTLRGDETEIFSILPEDIVAYADFTGQNTEGVFRAPVEFAKQGSALDVDALEISVEPPNITVTLEEKVVASVEVAPNLVGFPPPGYELTDYRLSPTQVAIVGPRSRVEGVRTILTEEIPLATRTEDFSEVVRLVRPDELIELPGGDVVDFRALITETVVQSSFENVEITILDLDPSLELASSLPDGTIRVQGKQLDLEGIPDSRIRIVVDASGVSGPGTYELPTRPQIPGGLLVLGIEPARIELVVTSRQEAEDEGAQ